MTTNHFTAHALFNQPIRLSAEEQARPLEVLREFFQNCHLGEVRQTLWQAVENALCANYTIYDTSDQRSHLLWFYRELERTLEAGLLLCKEGVYKKAKPGPFRLPQAPQATWPAKADLEHEILTLRSDNSLQNAEILQLRFFKNHGRMPADPEPEKTAATG